MAYTFRPAVTSESKPLVGLYSESGCGKTYSALLLARGFAGDTGRVGMIETEGGRGEAYADLIPGGYDVLAVRGSYAPKEYGEAITAAEKGGLSALIIDSASHEWEGVDGVLAMAAANQAAGKKGVLVWQQPKMEHQRQFMGRLIATPIPLVIVCMRAKYPMQENKQTREWIRSDKLEPKQSEDILFEMFCHGWIDREHKFRATKYTRPDWREIIRDGESISIETGRRLAAWSRGEKAAPRTQQTPSAAPAATPAPENDAGRDTLLSAISQRRGEMKPSAFVAALTKHALSTGDFAKAPTDVLESLLRDLPAGEPQGRIA